MSNTPRPNLFIVGAPKCGTTAWAEYLRSHPDIAFSSKKEPHFFCYDLNCRSVESEDAYLDLFEGCNSSSIAGEASVWYLLSEVAAESIKRFNSKAKIIILLRNQEDSLPSLHNQMLLSTFECIEDFNEAWRISEHRDPTNISRFCKEPKFLNYKRCGRFSEQVERYFSHFPAEQIRVFHFRDWSGNPRQTYLEILRFLGVPDDGKTHFPRVNEAKHYRLKRLSEFLINPPGIMRPGARFLQRLTSKRLGRLASWILLKNSARGYLAEVNEQIRNEIHSYYAADNALVEHRIWHLQRE